MRVIAIRPSSSSSTGHSTSQGCGAASTTEIPLAAPRAWSSSQGYCLQEFSRQLEWSPPALRSPPSPHLVTSRRRHCGGTRQRHRGRRSVVKLLRQHVDALELAVSLNQLNVKECVLELLAAIRDVVPDLGAMQLAR